ncbi:hypothetical protein B9Z55_018411 [Caenorhabditis nigoni]|uniref:G-protein coupled receptors family 1 profile domain-containing protein n=1 Tax=Caenorhabditis nigoni TaxID=1611254 RepID=A0A2G5TEL3_9PELO|nr:hypothetical protein B9Z55_018411 [Caenorhabditis nigoni]
MGRLYYSFCTSPATGHFFPPISKKKRGFTSGTSRVSVKLIVFITINFFIAEAPIGTIAILKTFLERTDKLFVTASVRYKVYLDLSAWTFQDHFRRCSSWLGVLMAIFIPCIAFPCLTVSLIRELRKFNNRVVMNGRKQSVVNGEKNDITTKLIVFMTFAFFIAEAPLGTIYLVKVFSNRDDEIL